MNCKVSKELFLVKFGKSSTVAVNDKVNNLILFVGLNAFFFIQVNTRQKSRFLNHKKKCFPIPIIYHEYLELCHRQKNLKHSWHLIC